MNTVVKVVGIGFLFLFVFLIGYALYIKAQVKPTISVNVTETTTAIVVQATLHQWNCTVPLNLRVMTIDFPNGQQINGTCTQSGNDAVWSYQLNRSLQHPIELYFYNPSFVYVYSIP
jgi:hypothetical protein